MSWIGPAMSVSFADVSHSTKLGLRLENFPILQCSLKKTREFSPPARMQPRAVSWLLVVLPSTRGWHGRCRSPSVPQPLQVQHASRHPGTWENGGARWVLQGQPGCRDGCSTCIGWGTRVEWHWPCHLQAEGSLNRGCMCRPRVMSSLKWKLCAERMGNSLKPPVVEMAEH